MATLNLQRRRGRRLHMEHAAVCWCLGWSVHVKEQPFNTGSLPRIRVDRTWLLGRSMPLMSTQFINDCPQLGIQRVCIMRDHPTLEHRVKYPAHSPALQVLLKAWQASESRLTQGGRPVTLSQLMHHHTLHQQAPRWASTMTQTRVIGLEVSMI